MWKNISRHAAAWISIVMLLYSFGCILSPEEDPAPPNIVPVEFMDLTEKEHVVTNMVLSHQEKDITEYSKLLLSPEDTYNGSTYANGYYWYNQEGAAGLPVFNLRDEDIAAVTNLFLAAKGTPAEDDHQVIERLTLSLTEGSWSPLAEIFGEACEDCWFTEREYNIKLYFGENSIEGLQNIQYYIVPVDEGGTKIYKIAVAKDIPKL